MLLDAFTMIRWAALKPLPPLLNLTPPCAACRRRAPLVAAVAAASSPEIIPAKFDEDNPSVPISSGLIVQADEGVLHPVVDLIEDIYRRLP
ncbi:hypothetical protein F511_45060 [Dorcoceras hygrometricum]|uniref:Uncharacterized protein n=1 Tax=Dorcoceras hygrometricum TaxID=472368 RepID=A0A2Z7A4Q4_9LAMI|nr:hypothetical protein F511_45060 [Dorcoceras hygrometricum]